MRIGLLNQGGSGEEIPQSLSPATLSSLAAASPCLNLTESQVSGGPRDSSAGVRALSEQGKWTLISTSSFH